MIWRPERNDPPRLLREAPCWVESLTWFPQGDRLLVRCTQDPSPVFTVLDADGTEIVGVREGAAGEISADGTRLFVRLGLPGDMTISMLELETFEVSEIATGSSATWRPHG